jgi:hypothetical protein
LSVLRVSPRAIAAFVAKHVLRQSMVFRGVPMLHHEPYIGNVAKVFDENGAISASTEKFLADFVAQFADWVTRLSK